jgi:hypothetical protein
MELFNYLLKVSACSALFFAFYLLVLRKLTFFKINRFYLLGSLLVSFIIPAMEFTIEREVVQSAIVAEPLVVQDVDLGGSAFQTPIVVSAAPVDYEIARFDWLTLLPYMYTGIVAMLLLLASWRIFKLLKHTKTPVKEINGLKLVSKRSGFTNCSFFNYVFIDENSLTETELAVLLAHEEVHARQYHSVDKLLMMVAKAVLWFNPIVYLYDKALEQAHEYEADETTSSHVGTEHYASLLLKLAVSKSSSPLIHNFVKSPIKERIKMLFNSKSKNMKKLAYLLALPIGLGLIWGFTIKITHPVKNPIVKQETEQQQDTLMGKTVKGKVIGFEKLKFEEVLNLQVGSTVIPISNLFFKNHIKIKIGDEITVALGGKISSVAPPPIGSKQTAPSLEKPHYMALKIISANETWTYKVPHYAFLYEANRARYAWSTIKSIEKNANGIINKIVLNDKHGFVINLNVAAQQFKSDDFKKSDEIVVKFIGEKLTGSKTYTTDKMIALYSWPKKYELINKSLYPKFYDENGKQIVYYKAGQPKISQQKAIEKPILENSSSPVVKNGSEFKDGSNDLTKLSYSAEDSIITNKNFVFLYGKAQVSFNNMDYQGSNIIYDNQQNTLRVNNASIYSRKSKKIIRADSAHIDLKNSKGLLFGPIWLPN